MPGASHDRELDARCRCHIRVRRDRRHQSHRPRLAAPRQPAGRRPQAESEHTMTHHIDLDAITLTHGGHQSREKGTCLMEAVAWWAHETHTDHPACVSPVLGTYGRQLNDALPDSKRQQLKPFIPLLPGTAGDGLDERRGYLALDWLIRTFTPAWLDLAGLAGEATALRDSRPVADLAAAEAVRPHVLAAHDKAAGTAAGDAAWDAAWAAAGDAAWAAVWDAAWAAARDAAGDAAGDAARAALAPTVDQLQDSAISLYHAMITGGTPWPVVLDVGVGRRAAPLRRCWRNVMIRPSPAGHISVSAATVAIKVTALALRHRASQRAADRKQKASTP